MSEDTMPEEIVIPIASLDPVVLAKNRLTEALEGNVWRVQEGRFLAYCGAPYDEELPYDIDLSALTTSAQILDWIAQVSRKTWATPQIVGDMVRLLDAILGLQENYCSFGIERGPFNAGQLLHGLVEQGVFDDLPTP